MTVRIIIKILNGSQLEPGELNSCAYLSGDTLRGIEMNDIVTSEVLIHLSGKHPLDWKTTQTESCGVNIEDSKFEFADP